jgi:glycerol-3-phosphate dehydrogenase
MMWKQDWRETIWSRLGQPWDMVIVGGGITGAGILRESARVGLKVLMVEQRDFAWGASSRSSKQIHGGLRYLKEGNIHLTWMASRQREQLLKEGAGLVKPLGYLLPVYKGVKPGHLTYSLALSIYGRMGSKHRHYSVPQFQLLTPHLTARGLKGGFGYHDAQTDDARLTLRVIQEAVADGGAAINYMAAEDIVRENGQVVGLHLHDCVTGRRAEVRARVVVNAMGAWADRLCGQIGAQEHLRPLRGSHLVFSQQKLRLSLGNGDHRRNHGHRSQTAAKRRTGHLPGGGCVPDAGG